jgi:hypothetical protein
MLIVWISLLYVGYGYKFKSLHVNVFRKSVFVHNSIVVKSEDEDLTDKSTLRNLYRKLDKEFLQVALPGIF